MPLPQTATSAARRVVTWRRIRARPWHAGGGHAPQQCGTDRGLRSARGQGGGGFASTFTTSRAAALGAWPNSSFCPSQRDSSARGSSAAGRGAAQHGAARRDGCHDTRAQELACRIAHGRAAGSRTFFTWFLKATAADCLTVASALAAAASCRHARPYPGCAAACASPASAALRASGAGASVCANSAASCCICAASMAARPVGGRAAGRAHRAACATPRDRVPTTLPSPPLRPPCPLASARSRAKRTGSDRERRSLKQTKTGCEIPPDRSAPFVPAMKSRALVPAVRIPQPPARPGSAARRSAAARRGSRIHSEP